MLFSRTSLKSVILLRPGQTLLNPQGPPESFQRDSLTWLDRLAKVFKSQTII